MLIYSLNICKIVSCSHFCYLATIVLNGITFNILNMLNMICYTKIFNANIQTINYMYYTI